MSRLEELIQQLCPDGVEYKYLGDVCSYATERIDAAEVNADNYVGVENLLPDKQGKTVASYVPSDGRWIHFRKDDILIGNIRPYLKKIWLATHDGGTNGDVLVIQIKNKNILRPQFLYYILSSDSFFNYDMQNAKGAKMPRGDKSAVLRYPIPLPPLPVQQEIVRILDSFTELTAELNEKLTAELTARKKQYEYYRDELFRTAKDASVHYLNEISDNCDNQRRPVTSGNRIAGKYPYYGASGIVDYVDDYIFDGDYLLISEDGANLLARSTPIAFSIAGKNWVNNHAHVLHFDTYDTRRYVEIYLNSIDLSSYITGGAQPKLNQKNLNKIPIPLPSPDEQHRIVSILDRFDALCNDLTSGLPAEIAARKKQYEYYRDKLLSFKVKT